VQLFPAGFQIADLLGKYRIFFAKTQDQCSIVVIGRIGHKRFDFYGRRFFLSQENQERKEDELDPSPVNDYDRLKRKSRIKMPVQEQFVVDAKGKTTGVILPLKRYRKLMEDLHDLAVIAERRADKPISFEEMKRRLKKDAVL
jgi:hypothetical protein